MLLVSLNTSTRIISYMTFNMAFVTEGHVKQLLQLIEDLARNMPEGKQTELILLDSSKAFDKVNHLKLLYKLQVYWVQGKTLG